MLRRRRPRIERPRQRIRAILRLSSMTTASTSSPSASARSDRPRARVAALAALTVATLLGATRDARADVVDTCVAAFDAGQLARKSSRLVAARKELLECARVECPKLVR